MARYMTLVKYEPEALAGVRADGFAARRDVLTTMSESFGGKLESYEVLNGSPDFDFVAVFDLPDRDALFAMTSFASATGIVADSEIFELLSAEDADAAIAAHQAVYTPPGEAGS